MKGLLRGHTMGPPCRQLQHQEPPSRTSHMVPSAHRMCDSWPLFWVSHGQVVDDGVRGGGGLMLMAPPAVGLPQAECLVARRRELFTGSSLAEMIATGDQNDAPIDYIA